MHAIISDIHGNLEALQAVLDSIDLQGVDGTLCLGDLVGYGPDSIECLRLALQWDVVLVGEWDRRLVDGDAGEWLPELREHLVWLRRQFIGSSDEVRLRIAMQGWPTTYLHRACLFSHTRPSDSTDFLFPEDVHNPEKLDGVAAEFDEVLFTGHTHIAGMFLRGRGNWSYLASSDNLEVDTAGYEKLVCNVGSVGQPRDGDARASFVLFDGRTIRFKRVEYDIEKTIDKIRAIPQINNMHGERLRYGR